jgi:Fic family protein
MFKPKYSYTKKVVDNVGRIREIVATLNERRFPNTVLVELEKSARALSSYSSTSIEGNRLALTDVKKILKSRPENIKNTQREVLNYNEALEKLNRKWEKGNDIQFTHELVWEIHQMVVKELIPKTETGKYRVQPVFVNDPRTSKTVYWPPDSEDVKELMDELINFVNQGDGKTDSIIKAGIFHKQFVIIHPFIDGNGRTVRLLTKLLLAKLGLDTFQLFSFENYYNLNITEYFKKVGVFNNYYDIVNEIDFTQWIEYFTDGIIDELERVSKILPKATSLRDRLEDYHYEIIDLIKEKGVIKDKDYAEISDRSRASRILDYRKLVDLDLIERKGKGRGTYYKLNDS